MSDGPSVFGLLILSPSLIGLSYWWFNLVIFGSFLLNIILIIRLLGKTS